jgi:hypothetical protein
MSQISAAFLKYDVFVIARAKPEDPFPIRPKQAMRAVYLFVKYGVAARAVG